MHPEAREELNIRFKLTVLEYAKYINVTDACREFNVPRSTFYRWKEKYEQEGRVDFCRKKTIAYYHPCKTAPEVVEKSGSYRALSNRRFADRVLPGLLPQD